MGLHFDTSWDGNVSIAMFMNYSSGRGSSDMRSCATRLRRRMLIGFGTSNPYPYIVELMLEW
jgi:hypothetical protein